MGAFDEQPKLAVPSTCFPPASSLAVSKQRQAAAVQSNPDRANRDPRNSGNELLCEIGVTAGVCGGGWTVVT